MPCRLYERRWKVFDQTPTFCSKVSTVDETIYDAALNVNRNVPVDYMSSPGLRRTAPPTALVVQSGSGKSTIVGLIERFYNTLKEIVKIDGRDIEPCNLRSMRRHVGMEAQERTLTIQENIA